MSPRSAVWLYVRDGHCRLCPTKSKITSKKSSNILRHIRRCHPDVYADIVLKRLSAQRSSASPTSPHSAEALTSMVKPVEMGDVNGNEENILGGSIQESMEAIEQFLQSGGTAALLREASFKDETAQLVADLMRQFFGLGWMFGSGGAMCIRVEGFTYVTPSGVQKDRIKTEDVGVYSPQKELIVPPARPNTVSSCIHLFWTIFSTNDGQFPDRPLNAVIHTHSVEANLIASFPTAAAYDRVRLSTEEMLKGIVDRRTGKCLSNTESCSIPVIENAPSEGSPEFKSRIESALLENPGTSCVLVRNHGAFYFGRTWEETKIMAEIFEYLFKLTLERLRFAPHLAEKIFVVGVKEETSS